MLLLHFVLEEKLVANKLLYNNLYSCVVVKVNHCIMLVYKFKWAMLTSVPFFFQRRWLLVRNKMGQTQSNIDLAPLINILKDINVQSTEQLDRYAQQLHDQVSIDIIPNLLNDLLLIILIMGFIALLVFGIALKNKLKRMDETLSEEDRLMRNTIRDRQYSKAMSADVNELIEIISKK